jgi:plastocyanin
VSRLPIVVIVTLSLSLFSGTTTPAHGLGATVYVTIYDYGFLPKNENITTGTTVVWNNTGAQGHTVFSNGTPSFQSSTYTIQPYGQPGQHTYSVFFGQAGVYQYYCSIHPFMTGVLNVTSSPVSPPSGGGGGGPSSGPTPTNGFNIYLILLVMAAVLLVGGAAFYAWRKRERSSRNQGSVETSIRGYTSELNRKHS